MEGSQEEATAVALRALGQPVKTHIEIGDVLDESPAKESLRVGDRIVRGETTVTTTDSIRTALQTVRRASRSRSRSPAPASRSSPT